MLDLDGDKNAFEQNVALLNPGNFQQRRSKFAIDHHPLRSDVFLHPVTLVTIPQLPTNCPSYGCECFAMDTSSMHSRKWLADLMLHHDPSWYKYIGIIIQQIYKLWISSTTHQPFCRSSTLQITTSSLRIITHQSKGGFVLWISGKHVVLQKDVKLHRPHCSCRHKNGWDGYMR